MIIKWYYAKPFAVLTEAIAKPFIVLMLALARPFQVLRFAGPAALAV
jgi:hypothetical protein